MALGFDKEGSSKGEVSCVFQGSSPVTGLPWRSPSARHSRMEAAGVLREWQGRALSHPQAGSRAGQGQPETHIKAWLMDDVGPESS